jgi:hypothetical protein
MAVQVEESKLWQIVRIVEVNCRRGQVTVQNVEPP